MIPARRAANGGANHYDDYGLDHVFVAMKGLKMSARRVVRTRKSTRRPVVDVAAKLEQIAGAVSSVEQRVAAIAKSHELHISEAMQRLSKLEAPLAGVTTSISTERIEPIPNDLYAILRNVGIDCPRAIRVPIEAFKTKMLIDLSGPHPRTVAFESYDRGGNRL